MLLISVLVWTVLRNIGRILAERNQCYSQEEEDLYYITPKYKKVLPSTLAPTDNSKLQPWDGLQMREGKEAPAN